MSGVRFHRKGTYGGREQRTFIAHIDAASRGNPGFAGIGVVLENPDGLAVYELSKGIGKCTRNVAEWRALIWVLKWAVRRGGTPLSVRSDSKLVVEQMRGRSRVTDRRSRQFHAEARELAALLPRFEIQWVPRKENKRAHLLAEYGARAV